jgi:hypothetical protein
VNKKIKAKRYWKTACGSYLYADKKSAQYFSGFHAGQVAPVTVLPADADSIERMVNQIVLAMSKTDGTGVDLARAALAAIGVKSKRPA